MSQQNVFLTHDIANRKFLDKLKLSDISTIFKAVNITAKKNYRPVSIEIHLKKYAATIN